VLPFVAPCNLDTLSRAILRRMHSGAERSFRSHVINVVVRRGTLLCLCKSPAQLCLLAAEQRACRMHCADKFADSTNCSYDLNETPLSSCRVRIIGVLRIDIPVS
jgi:hypothetical protein